MKKKILALLMCCSIMFTGCAYNTVIDVNSNGSYKMDMVKLDNDESSPDIDLYKSSDSLYSESMDKINSMIDYKNITSETFLVKISDSTKFRKTPTIGYDFDEDFGYQNMSENLLTVNMPKEIKVSNGVVSGNTVVFDLTENLGTYYASCDETYKYDTVAPVISGVKDDTFYSKPVKIFCKDKDLDSLVLNGDIIKSGYKVTKNGTYFLKAVDKYGNITYVNFFVNIDKTAPTISYDTDDFWMKQQRPDIDYIKKVNKNTIKLGKNVDSAYMFISDLEYLTTDTSIDLWYELPISKISAYSRCLDLSNGKALELDEPISSLKYVKINGKKISPVNGVVIYKVEKGKSYKVVAKDKLGNTVKKVVKVK